MQTYRDVSFLVILEPWFIYSKIRIEIRNLIFNVRLYTKVVLIYTYDTFNFLY